MSDEPKLGEFFTAAGRSLADAQNMLTGATSSVLALSEAELEVKATVATQANGALAVQTVSATEARRGSVNPALLSTMRLRYVALAPDAPPPSAIQPTRPSETIIGDFRKQRDIVALTKALGDLKIEATFIPERARWLVSVHDSEGRLVREAVVADAPDKG